MVIDDYIYICILWMEVDIHKEKSEGMSTDHWGTPYFIEKEGEKNYFIIRNIFLHYSYGQIDMK